MKIHTFRPQQNTITTVLTRCNRRLHLFF